MNTKSENNQKLELVRSLMDIPLEKETYEADLEVTDRYQQFSAEILRLALAGIGVFGFVLKDVVLNENNGGKYALAFSQASWCFGSGLGVLGLAAGLALAHRYYASDCIAIQICYLRARGARDASLKTPGDDQDAAAKHNNRMAKEKNALGKSLKLCSRILALAATALGIGIGLVTAGLAWTLF